MTEHSPDAPKVLADRYELGGLIGRGGMAEVYVGRDTRLSRTVAIKMLRSDLARDPSFLARFRREAQSSAGLNHPAIVAVYDTGEQTIGAGTPDERHIPFIIMEYVEGHTVRDLLGDGDPVPIGEAVEIVSGVLGALEYSHREGIVHRDIKPGNIMITPTGDVKVMDFGIARALSDNSATMTQPHSVVGTAQYLSPEQARGEVVDARSDLYSTGCLLFELLTGKPPFTGDSAVAVAYQHVRELPPTPSTIASDIPESLDRVVMKSLAKDRDERYADAAHFRTDLLAAYRGSAVSAPATDSWAAEAAQPTRVVPAAAGLGAGLAAGSATSAGAAEEPENYRRTPQPVETEEKRSFAWLWILLAALIVVGGVVTYLIVTGGDDEETPTVTMVDVPSLEGMTEEDVRAELDGAGLVPSFADPESSSDVEEGVFLRSEPEPGTPVESGSAVTVVMSAGPEEIEVPELDDSMDRADVEAAFEGVELELQFTDPVEDDEVDEGNFVSSAPRSGTPVPTGSTVQVTLSAGAGQVEVPNVAQRTQDEARSALEAANLTAGTVQTVDEPGAEAGQVIRTDPEAGALVDAGTAVTLYVASGNVNVPDLTNATRDEAETRLNELDLNVTVNVSSSDDVEEGRVINQSDTGLVPQGTRIVLEVSSGPDESSSEPPETPSDGNGDGGNGGNGGNG
ncbi:Serine/threonine protein kinase PrkC, regulator of stationary phase [Actinomycetales bacterium JB111]|nr:Serine/threonine protein kinase PrkC, regulator of stationary phase [Actinomycetales bacterium JB111]